MKEALFGPAMTGPIDDPRAALPPASVLTETLFDDRTRARLVRVAQSMRASPPELIREATLRYLDVLEAEGGQPAPDVQK